MCIRDSNISVLFQSQRGEKGGGKEPEIPSPPDMPIRAINPSFAGPWLALPAHQVARVGNGAALLPQCEKVGVVMSQLRLASAAGLLLGIVTVSLPSAVTAYTHLRAHETPEHL